MYIVHTHKPFKALRSYTKHSQVHRLVSLWGVCADCMSFKYTTGYVRSEMAAYQKSSVLHGGSLIVRHHLTHVYSHLQLDMFP